MMQQDVPDQTIFPSKSQFLFNFIVMHTHKKVLTLEPRCCLRYYYVHLLPNTATPCPTHLISEFFLMKPDVQDCNWPTCPNIKYKYIVKCRIYDTKCINHIQHHVISYASEFPSATPLIAFYAAMPMWDHIL